MMDCWEAQELLEGIDLGAIRADDALAIEARRHQAHCAACQKVMSGRHVWNARLSDAMSAVEIPEGLESRLSNLLGPIVPASVAVSPPPSTRRRWLVSLATVASLLLIALLWQPWKQSGSIISLAIVDAHIGSDLTDLTPYDQTVWKPELPRVWRSFFQLEPDLMHHFPAGSPSVLSIAALVPFEFRSSAAATPIRGRLVMVPLSHFREPPDDGDFSVVSDVEYIPGFSRCVWREGDWVYICYVRSVGGAELRELMQLMRESRNFT